MNGLPNRVIKFGEDDIEPALLREAIIDRDARRREKLKPLPGTHVGLPLDVKPERYAWMEFAACRDMDTKLFFHVGRTHPDIARACANCAVREQCLVQALIDDAMNKESFGYRGGHTAASRDRMRGRKVALLKNKSAEVRRRFNAECGGVESDTELIARLVREVEQAEQERDACVLSSNG